MPSQGTRAKRCRFTDFSGTNGGGGKLQLRNLLSTPWTPEVFTPSTSKINQTDVGSSRNTFATTAQLRMQRLNLRPWSQPALHFGGFACVTGRSLCDSSPNREKYCHCLNNSIHRLSSRRTTRWNSSHPRACSPVP